LKYFRAKLENLSQQSQAMLLILPEESPSPDWWRDREPLPEAVVAGVPPALWLIPQPTRLLLQKTRTAATGSG
jgi:hypothetical protein